MGDDGYAKIDPTLEHPRCVYQLMKKHYSRYTPGDGGESLRRTAAEIQARGGNAGIDRSAGTRRDILYALGWTQHSTGAETLRTGAMVQLLLGNMGIAGGGMNALRGRSNIQGLTDLGLLTNMLPGYLSRFGEAEQEWDAYVAKRAQAAASESAELLQQLEEIPGQLHEGLVGRCCDRGKNWAFDYLPKLDKPYDMMQAFELMIRKMTGYICRGFNIWPRRRTSRRPPMRWSKLKVAGRDGPAGRGNGGVLETARRLPQSRSNKIQTEVFRLPTTCFAEERGSLVSSSRVLQWHWQGAEGPGQSARRRSGNLCQACVPA
jgi:formate dehydrogenase major subunit